MNLMDDSVQTEVMVLKNQHGEDIRSLVEHYPEEYLDKLLNNKDKLNKIASKFNCSLTAISKTAMVMKCNTRTCPFSSMCILAKNDIAPEGYSCPVESKLVDELSSSIIKDLDVDTQNAIEMDMLYDLIDIKLLDLRTSGLLGAGSVVQEITLHSGNLTTSTRDVAPEIKVKLELKRLKFSIMEEFMATRKAKKKYGISGTSTFESIIRKAMTSGDEL